MIHDIPFVAKRPPGSAPWIAFGGSRADYDQWVPHVCAMACCRSLILARFGCAPDLWGLTQDAASMGVYVEEVGGIRGAFHNPLVDFLSEFHIRTYRFGSQRSDALAAAVAAGPVLLSIDLAAVDRQHRGSHLVLVVGRDGQDYVVHDNARLLGETGEGCRLSAERLEAISNAKGIAVTSW